MEYKSNILWLQIYYIYNIIFYSIYKFNNKFIIKNSTKIYRIKNK